MRSLLSGFRRARSAERVPPAIRTPGRALGTEFWFGAGWLGLVVFVALFAWALPLQDPLALNLGAVNSGPSPEHWLGTDSLGRDTLARIVFGARITVIVGLGSVALGFVIGVTLGLVAGFARGWVDALISWVVNVLLAFPPLVLALALAAFLGASLQNVIIAIGVIAVPGFARLARATTIQVVDREFVVVARSLGARNLRLVISEVLPNIMQPVLTMAITVVGLAIVVEGALSFLSLGVPLPEPTWGGIIAAGQAELVRNPTLVLAPSVTLLLTVLALNLVAERLGTRFGWTEVRT